MRDVFIDFFMYFEKYCTARLKAATLDPFENFRVFRGLRYFHQV